MGIAKTYKEADHLYNKSINISKNWISKYYPDRNYSFFGVPLERVQSFSQHYFFSCLLEELPIEQVWCQYPITTQNIAKNVPLKNIKSLFTNVKKVVLSVLSSRARLPDLNFSRDIIFVTSGRHLSDQLFLLSYLNKKFKILIIGKIPLRLQEKLKLKKIHFIDIPSGMKLISRIERFKNLFQFNFSKWNKKGSNVLLNSKSWQSRLLYLRLIQFPEIKALLSVSHTLLDNIKPSIVLTTSSNDTFGASFSLIAKKMGICVLELDHGYSAWSQDNAFTNSDFKLFWGDVFAFIDPSIKNKMVKVGCPYLKKPTVSSYDHLINLNNKAFIGVLVLWSPPYGSVSAFKSKPNSETLLDLVTGLSKLPQNYSVTLRSHPSYDINDDLVGIQLQKRFKVANKKGIESVLKDHDIVITQPTTASLYAMLHKKPMIYFDNSWFTEHLGHPFVKSKSALGVPIVELANINNFVLKLINNHSLLKSQMVAQKKFIGRYIECFGEDSCHKIERFIKGII